MENNDKMKNNRKNHLSVIILAGGRSIRIGENKDKSLMKLKGVKLIDRVYSKIISSGYFYEKDVIIVGPKEKFPDYSIVVEDIFPGKGPLGGIYSGLKTSDTSYNLVIGCDMPFIEKELIQLMIKEVDGSNDDIIIPTYGEGLVEPLCAIYSKKCLPIIVNNMKEGKLSVRSIFPYLKVKKIKEEDIRKFDPHFHSFFNINYKKDFVKAKKLDRQGGTQVGCQ